MVKNRSIEEGTWCWSLNGPEPVSFDRMKWWYTGLWSSRTSSGPSFMLRITRPDIRIAPPRTRLYRNPVIFAIELQAEMTTDHLTRQQLADRHGISLDRVIQWLALLKLPVEQLEEIANLGDHWDHQVVTEREVRRIRQHS